MPEVLRFHLQGMPPANLFQHATGLRAVVFGWLQTADPDLSRRIHDANQSKPFSISSLCIDNANCGLWFEIAVLDDQIIAPLLKGIALSGYILCLGPQMFKLERIETIAQTDWAALLAPPSPRLRDFTFEILSPTAHHASGELRKSIVLPAPELYFGSWRGRWNACCPFKFDDAILELVAAQVAVKECEGGTHAIRLDEGRPFIGFQGTVRFTILKPDTITEEARTALVALARFASFCGTGVDTMRGMGRTVYLENAS